MGQERGERGTQFLWQLLYGFVAIIGFEEAGWNPNMQVRNWLHWEKDSEAQGRHLGKVSPGRAEGRDGEAARGFAHSGPDRWSSNLMKSRSEVGIPDLL